MKDIVNFYILAAALALAALLGITFHLLYWAGLIVAALAYAGCVVYQYVKSGDKGFDWQYFLFASAGGAFISLCFGLSYLL